MAFTRIRPYLISAAVKKPLQIPVARIGVDVPPGARFRLDYIFIVYPVTINTEDGLTTQASPNLFFELFDSRGVSLTNRPVPIVFLTPGGVDGQGGAGVSPIPHGASVRGLPRWGVEYDPLANIRMEITGMNAGPVPAWISITYLGMRDRMRV